MSVQKSLRMVPILLVLALGISMVGCGVPQAAVSLPEATQAAVPAPEATKAEVQAASEELVIAVPSENVDLSSWQAQSEINSPGLRNVFELLVERDPITNELVPELATGWEQISPTQWRFTLREGVTFHDGSPFNAESAAFGINWTWAPENNFPGLQFMGSQITAEAVDEYTLDVFTAEPDPIVPARMYFCPLPSMKALLDSPETYATNPVGTGPYKVAEFKRGQEIIYEANPEWWGLDDPEARGAITFQKLRFVFRPEDGVRAAMAQNGEADIAAFLTPEQCATVDALDGVRCESAPSSETLMMRYDTPSPVLGDQRIREAIGLAIDRDLIIEQILGGVGSPAAMIIGPGVLGWSADLAPFAYDPDKAKQLIAAAKADGVPVDSTTLTINVRQASIPRIAEIAQAVQSMLIEVGLDVNIQVQEASIFNPEFGEKPTPERNYITIHPHGNELFDYTQSLSYYTCSTTVSCVCDPELDKMIQVARTLADSDREEAFREIAQYTYDRQYIGGIAYLGLAYGISDRVTWNVPLDHRLLAKDMSLSK